MRLQTSIEMPRSMVNPFGFFCPPNGATPDVKAWSDPAQVAACAMSAVVTGWLYDPDSTMTPVDVYWLQFSALQAIIEAVRAVQGYAWSMGELPEQNRYEDLLDGQGPSVSVGPRDSSGEPDVEVHFHAEWHGNALAVVARYVSRHGPAGDDDVFWMTAEGAMNPDNLSALREMRTQYEDRYAMFSDDDGVNEVVQAALTEPA